MRIYLEFLIPSVVILMLFFWRLWYVKSLKKAKKNYNPNDDKARLGEQARRNGGDEKPGTRIPKTEFNSGGSAPIEKPTILPTANPVADGKDSNSPRETSNSNGTTPKPRRKFRNPFRRRSA